MARRRRRWDLDDILAVHWSHEIAAQRYAVVLPIVGNRGVEEPADASGAVRVRNAMRRLRHCWLKSLASLRAAGWEPVRVPAEYWRMANCPPFGVVRRGTSLVCGRRILCPYCWARQISRDLYRRLVWACCCLEKQCGSAPYLLEWHLRWREPDVSSPTFLADLLLAARERQKLADSSIHGMSAGRYLISTLEPLEGGHRWLTHQRGVAVLVDSSSSAPDLVRLSSDNDLRLLPSSPSTFSAVVGRVTSYPAELLKGPAPVVASLLHQRARMAGSSATLRLSQVFGVLRNRLPRKRLRIAIPVDEEKKEVRLEDRPPPSIVSS